jgi:hypothetical protein
MKMKKNNVIIVHDNNLLTIDSTEVQKSNNVFHKPRKRHSSANDNIVADIKSDSTRKIDNSYNNDNNLKILLT